MGHPDGYFRQAAWGQAAIEGEGNVTDWVCEGMRWTGPWAVLSGGAGYVAQDDHQGATTKGSGWAEEREGTEQIGLAFFLLQLLPSLVPDECISSPSLLLLPTPNSMLLPS